MHARLPEDPSLLAEFVGLLVECPMHGGNPGHCQLNHVRTLPMCDRYEWAKGLTIQEAVHIRRQCRSCMCSQKRAWGMASE